MNLRRLPMPWPLRQDVAAADVGVRTDGCCAGRGDRVLSVVEKLAAPQSGAAGSLLSSGFKQLHVEDEHAAGAATAEVLAVREVSRDPEATRLALDHELKALGQPAMTPRSGKVTGLPRVTRLSNISPFVCQPV